MLSRLRTWPWIIFDYPKNVSVNTGTQQDGEWGRQRFCFLTGFRGGVGRMPRVTRRAENVVFVDGNQHKVCKPKKSDFHRLETRKSGEDSKTNGSPAS